MRDRSLDEPVYVISVAAKLVGVHPQTLRTYERLGFVQPRRTRRGQRLYCEADLERIRQIRRLTEEMGVNLAGVEIILKLLERVEQLQQQVQRLMEELERGPRQLKPAQQDVLSDVVPLQAPRSIEWPGCGPRL